MVTVVPARDRGDVRITSEELPEGFFEGQTAADIKSVHFCSETRQFLVQTAGDLQLFGAELATGPKTATFRRRLTACSSEAARVLSVKQAQVFVLDDGGITAHSIEPAAVDSDGAVLPSQSASSGQPPGAGE